MFWSDCLSLFIWKAKASDMSQTASTWSWGPVISTMCLTSHIIMLQWLYIMWDFYLHVGEAGRWFPSTWFECRQTWCHWHDLSIKWSETQSHHSESLLGLWCLQLILMYPETRSDHSESPFRFWCDPIRYSRLSIGILRHPSIPVRFRWG